MLVGISGSLREASVNTKLVHEAARLYGGAFTLANIRFPLYDGDLEAASGVPEAVEALAAEIAAAEAVVIASPEYNQSMSGVLKNALDWISRTSVKPWANKPVALLSAAAGRSGGARGSYALRLAMTPFKPRLLPGDILVAGAAKEFDDAGRLTSEIYTRDLGALMDTLKAEAQRG